MSKQFDLKKEWPAIKKQLLQLSRDAVEMARKGEKELVKISKVGKLHVDSTALNLKKDQLFKQIGKEYVIAKSPGAQSAKMKKLIKEFQDVEIQIGVLQRKLRKRPAVKRSVKKRTSSAMAARKKAVGKKAGQGGGAGK